MGIESIGTPWLWVGFIAFVLIFAILGLRALYFSLAGMMGKFHHPKLRALRRELTAATARREDAHR